VIWNGSTWSISPSGPAGAASDLTAVSCASTDSCVAVGDFFQENGSHDMYSDSWNGTHWTWQQIELAGHAETNQMYAVSCVASGCMAVGFSAANEWTGRSWVNVAAPAGFTSLDGVSCLSLSWCVAVGSNGSEAVADKWNGRTWTSIAGSQPARSSLSSVDCL